MASCGTLISRRDIVGDEDTYWACIRSKDHDGPHLARRLDWTYVFWDTDLCPPGECDDCDGEDPVDYCLYYGEITSARELQKYLDDPSYTGK